ncbi:MAG TPA: hypothetical protein ENG63_03400, partial [Candidatus Desulfofervidus auxilii]|nr:hypothetical protein [Candidatus Desulfofervidus auxilii]
MIQKKKSERNSIIFVHPDDIYKNNLTYRKVLMEYNKRQKNENSYNLCSALDLYWHPIYRKLKEIADYKEIFVYILSAGWGLVRGDFLLPYYD